MSTEPGALPNNLNHTACRRLNQKVSQSPSLGGAIARDGVVGADAPRRATACSGIRAGALAGNAFCATDGLGAETAAERLAFGGSTMGLTARVGNAEMPEADAEVTPWPVLNTLTASVSRVA